MVSVTLDRRGRGGAGYSVAPILPALVDTTRLNQVDPTKLFLDAFHSFGGSKGKLLIFFTR